MVLTLLGILFCQTPAVFASQKMNPQIARYNDWEKVLSPHEISLMEFLREREAPSHVILTALKDAADQLPKSARADEAQLLSEIQRKAANSRRSEPQELGALLVHVLERLGVTSQSSLINSTSLEAPEADASVSDR